MKINPDPMEESREEFEQFWDSLPAGRPYEQDDAMWLGWQAAWTARAARERELRTEIANGIFELAREVEKQEKWFIGGFLGSVMSEWKKRNALKETFHDPTK